MCFQSNAILLMLFHRNCSLAILHSHYCFLLCFSLSIQQCSINNDMLLENTKMTSVFSKASRLFLLCILAIMNLPEVWTIFWSNYLKKNMIGLCFQMSPSGHHSLSEFARVCESNFSNSMVSTSLMASKVTFNYQGNYCIEFVRD